MEEYLFDKEYIESYGLMTNGNPDFGFIYIETERDKRFWEIFFGNEILKNYEINFNYKTPTMHCGTRGKVRYEGYYKKANKRAIIAIDSDFDHLTPNRFEYCEYIINNPFVFHTFAYTKENIFNSVEVLDECLSKYYFSTPSSYRLDEFLSNYSELIHDVCVKFVSILDLKLITDESTLYEKIIPSDNELEKMFFNSDYDSFNSEIIQYEKDLDELLNGADISYISVGFTNFGMDKTNTYQFISGHKLEKRIIDVIVTLIRRKLHKQAMTEFKDEGAQGEMLSNRNSEICNHFDEMIRFSTLRANSQNFENNNIYRASKEQLGVLFS
ncbi:DUF4435 domain-containing protein [Photobacterium phosphoreum]|uniref:DUF4435 domain-containing protein n=1 Tax=Photobacterium phosphoreum TaxID=659 RepID=UPI0039AF1092